MAEHNYVAGFLLSPRGVRVALVQKAKPEWQRGRLNGIGGKVEPGESPAEAMQREFLEETGLVVEDWELFCVLDCVDQDGNVSARVHFFRAEDHRCSSLNGKYSQNAAGELFAVFSIELAPWDRCIDNLRWLVPMASAQCRNDWPYAVAERASEEVVDG